MPETDGLASENAVSITEEMQMLVAEKVREDSQNHTELTSIGTINKLLSELDTDDLTVNFDDMQKEEKYQDIQSVVAIDGTIYLYSTEYITTDQAEILAQPEDIKPIIAERVRENSKKLAQLTGIDSVFAVGSKFETDKIKVALTEMAEDDSYGDIKSIVSVTGATYLYSDTYIANNYANILIRAKAKDPCFTIASTVRDESRMYPRPTSVEFFKEEVFNIDPDELEAEVAHIMERQEFEDIKMISTSTGVPYLYSNLYLTEDHAKALAEWIEVEQFENP